ncbi:MAG: zf-TFIIB domain-containing protein [Chitinophagales bacterium]|nr:zf-TFIIB domain-containing protein [Bacteroidota bacterium]
MKCPVCIDKDLLMTDRQGVEIDYCPTCRGVWLDRGELDKLIDRSGEGADSFKKSKHQLDESDNYKQNKHPQHYKKKSIWGEIFDF